MRIARESYERISEVEPVRTRKIESIIISILSIGALFGILAAIIILIIMAYQKYGAIITVGMFLACVLTILTDNL